MDAPRQSNRPLEIGHIAPLFPGARPGRRRLMPQVIDARAVEHRHGADAARPQPTSEVVVLAAPADEILIESVDSLELRSGQCKVAAAKRRLRLVSDQTVPD